MAGLQRIGVDMVDEYGFLWTDYGTLQPPQRELPPASNDDARETPSEDRPEPRGD